MNIKLSSRQPGVPQALESLADDGYNLIFNLEYDFEALIQGTGGSKPIAEMYPGHNLRLCKRQSESR